MGISKKKMQIVINNYFKQECDVNTSIREAFEKGFRIGIKKASSAQPGQGWNEKDYALSLLDLSRARGGIKYPDYSALWDAISEIPVREETDG